MRNTNDTKKGVQITGVNFQDTITNLMRFVIESKPKKKKAVLQKQS